VTPEYAQLVCDVLIDLFNISTGHIWDIWPKDDSLRNIPDIQVKTGLNNNNIIITMAVILCGLAISNKGDVYCL